MNDILKQLELDEKEKQTTLKKIHKVVAAWGLKLPKVEACPLHFGLNDFYHIGETEFDINNNVKEGYCGKFIFMFKGQVCPMHHHNKKHETFFIVKGGIEMELPGGKIIMNQGDHMPISQGVKHRFTALQDTLVLESSRPDLVDDSIFEDGRINKIIFGKEQP